MQRQRFRSWGKRKIKKILKTITQYFDNRLHWTEMPFKKLKLQYPTVTARLHAEIEEKITISFEVKKILKSKIFKVENIF